MYETEHLHALSQNLLLVQMCVVVLCWLQVRCRPEVQQFREWQRGLWKVSTTHPRHISCYVKCDRRGKLHQPSKQIGEKLCQEDKMLLNNNYITDHVYVINHSSVVVPSVAVRKR